MERADWVLLAVSAASQGPLEPVQLQKALFLLGSNVPGATLGADGFYVFEPYDYGPFSRAVYEDAETLADAGLLLIRRPPDVRFKLFSATETGRQRADQMVRRLPESVANYLRAVVDFTQSLSFNQLVAAVYREYPAMKANSVFKE